MSDQYSVGDRVEVLVQTRSKEFRDTREAVWGEWLPGEVIDVSEKTVKVLTDRYYIDRVQSVPYSRIRRLIGEK